MNVPTRLAVKYFRSFALGLALLVSWNVSAPNNRSQAQTRPPSVLVELFTSEGCSSCPPADEFLARLNHEQPLGGITVIGIEEHVDYWNHDGWIDPYSSAEWTSRQVTYVDRLKENSPYTPQAVIDGQRSVVGVHEREIVQAIRQSAQQPQAEIELTLEPLTSDGTLKLRVHAGRLPTAASDSAEVWLAIAEKDLGQKVSQGENAGRELRHSAVLRSLKKLGTASTNGETAFDASAQAKLNRAWKSQNLAEVVFLQD